MHLAAHPRAGFRRQPDRCCSCCGWNKTHKMTRDHDLSIEMTQAASKKMQLLNYSILRRSACFSMQIAANDLACATRI